MSVPDFNGNEWKKFCLLSVAQNATVPVSYSVHYATSRSSWIQAGKPSNKSTHEHRGAGARHAQEAGADVSAIAQHGHWLHDRVSTHYLSHIPSGVALKMAGCTMPGERLWLARNTLIPPIALQRKLFPFIETYFNGDRDWLQWMENIMMDQEVTYGRPSVPPGLYDTSSAPRLRFFVLLARLRKVVLQDAVALMDINTDATCDYSKHHVFRLPIFDDPLFHQYRVDLRKSIATSVSPHSLKLSTVTPLISHEIRSISHLTTTLFERLSGRFDNMEATLTDTQKVWSNLLSEAVGRQLQETEAKMLDICDVFQGVAETFAEASTSVKDRMTTGFTKISSRPSMSPLSRQSQSSHQRSQAQSQHAYQNASHGQVRGQRNKIENHREELRQARLGKQPVGRGSSSSNPNPVILPVSPSQVYPNESVILSEDQASIDGGSPATTQYFDSVDHDSVVGASNSPDPSSNRVDVPAVPICLMPPGPGGPLIFDLEHPFDIDMLCSDKLKFDWLEPQIATAKHPVRLAEEYVMLPRDAPLRRQWKEWFYGKDPLPPIIIRPPSIFQLNKHHKTSWRSKKGKEGNALAHLYKFKRTLIQSVMRLMWITGGGTLREVEQWALLEVEGRIEAAGSNNKYVKAYLREFPPEKRRRGATNNDDDDD